MGKLMEGRGAGRPGVAGKVGELLEAIRGGEWCEQQASQMRALAFGILEPGGERDRMARLHQRECPACRAYVLSLRGLAAVLPPLPLQWALGLASAVGAGAKASAGARAGAGSGAGVGTISASGAVGAGGAAGGGWLLGGSIGAKLAVSCVLALSVGCVALTVAPHQARHRGVRREAPKRTASIAGTDARLAGGSTQLGGALAGGPSTTASGGTARSASASSARGISARHAQREFGPEQPAVAGATAPITSPAPVTARAASRHLSGGTAGEEAAAPAPAGPPTHAEREFGPESSP